MHLLFHYTKGRIKFCIFLKLNIYISSLNVKNLLTVMCVCCGVYCVTELCGGVGGKNADALKNVLFRCRLSFCDVLDVVAATYNAFQKCLQPCYECGGRNLSNKHNYL